jgi:hypothetical protein
MHERRASHATAGPSGHAAPPAVEHRSWSAWRWLGRPAGTAAAPAREPPDGEGGQPGQAGPPPGVCAVDAALAGAALAGSAPPRERPPAAAQPLAHPPLPPPALALTPMLTASLLCGCVSGFVASTVTFPLDVVRRRMQVRGAGGGPGCASPPRYAEVIAQIRRSGGGWRGFYAGIVPEYCKVIPGVAISFCTYEVLKAWLEV